MANSQLKTNNLIIEKSPYLLQHAYNPVNWYSWCNKAFELAKKENKPIFLSIGYSTCHWCHVMEHESFEDLEVAKLLNEHFISIKVDREERPDLDNIYMTVCQMMTGSGGWPLTIIMTPDKKPFFSGTYFPKESRYERIGMLDLLARINDAWRSKKDDAIKSADEIVNYLNQISVNKPGNGLREADLKAAYEQLEGRFDHDFGGFGMAPKFPTCHNLLFLLRYWRRTKNTTALEITEKMLSCMRLGGIYDQIGFGFHRYSTDREWLVPHFEKMLYDQAMIAMAYTETYQATQKIEYKKIACEIFEYVLRDMTSSLGGFYSAEDADSEGVEGKFYVWTEEKIRNVLTKEEADLIISVFNIERSGNFHNEATRVKTGENILHLKKSIPENLQNQTETIRQKLFNIREKRIHPYKDDKILTDWNGLMIAALAKGAQAFNESKYAEAAKRAFDFIKKHLQNDGRLLHRFRDGEAKVNGNLDDYAFLIWGLLELYEATFEIKYLKDAINLNNDLIKHFWDKTDGGFYFTSSDTEEVLIRKKEIYDGAIPSGNSVVMLNLLRLSHFMQDEKLKEYAHKIDMTFSNNIKEAPLAYTQFLCGIDFKISAPCEIVISGNPDADDTKAMLNIVRKQFLPNKVLFLNPNEKEFPHIKNKFSINGKATAYVCSNYTCKAPITEIGELVKELN